MTLRAEAHVRLLDQADVFGVQRAPFEEELGALELGGGALVGAGGEGLDRERGDLVGELVQLGGAGGLADRRHGGDVPDVAARNALQQAGGVGEAVQALVEEPELDQDLGGVGERLRLAGAGAAGAVHLQETLAFFQGLVQPAEADQRVQPALADHADGTGVAEQVDDVFEPVGEGERLGVAAVHRQFVHLEGQRLERAERPHRDR